VVAEDEEPAQRVLVVGQRRPDRVDATVLVAVWRQRRQGLLLQIGLVHGPYAGFLGHWVLLGSMTATYSSEP
jgi:hypothetical protein